MFAICNLTSCVFSQIVRYWYELCDVFALMFDVL